MKRHASAPLTISRRKMTEGLLATLGGAFVFRSLAACTGGTSDSDEIADADAGSSSSSSSSSSGSTATSTTTGSSTAWATGGTASMTAKATYTNPFAGAATACALLVAATQGPCTEDADEVREDISEGYSGLPVRLGFRVLDTSCNPIVGATVKIWHTQLNGSYSGNTPNPTMCVKDSADYAKHYFRGTQTTDANGIVYFDSCFPGWYRGRTPHIHYTATINGKSFTSQVVFDQDLVEDIFANHAEYSRFGEPDTTNASDNVVGNNALSTFVLETERQSDGAMLAYKNLIVFNA